LRANELKSLFLKAQEHIPSQTGQDTKEVRKLQNDVHALLKSKFSTLSENELEDRKQGLANALINYYTEILKNAGNALKEVLNKTPHDFKEIEAALYIYRAIRNNTDTKIFEVKELLSVDNSSALSSYDETRTAAKKNSADAVKMLYELTNIATLKEEIATKMKAIEG
ncbi:MAG: hypothetical protein NTU49_04470, partial [Gammaproteobacteria bacterium]|nr:hypothetical protein [Gammaproteobacteria bacterium]